jgi:hypothetical protein
MSIDISQESTCSTSKPFFTRRRPECCELAGCKRLTRSHTAIQRHQHNRRKVSNCAQLTPMLTWYLNLKHMNPHTQRPTMLVAMRPFAGAVLIHQTRISCAIQHLNSHVYINCKSELRRMLPCRSSSTMSCVPLVRVFITTSRGGSDRLKSGRRNFWEPHVSLCATVIWV